MVIANSRNGVRNLKIIPLTRGCVAKVSDEDYDELSQYKWQVEIGRNGDRYAVRCRPRDKNGKQKQVRMHREIMRARRGVEVDHINGDGLDNQRDNLRIATRQQNSFNTRARSGYKGVSQRGSKQGAWSAHIRRSGKSVWVGGFATEADAARGYDAMARATFGRYARLNFPDEDGPVGVKEARKMACQSRKLFADEISGLPTADQVQAIMERY